MKLNKLASLLALASVLGACDNDFKVNETYLSADELEISATPVQVGGANSNVITLENHSPMPSEWTMAQMGSVDKKSTRSCDQFIATHTGINDIKFRSFSALDGGYVEKTLQVQVDVITEIPEYIATRLCVGQEGAPTSFSNDFDPALVKAIPELDAQGRAGNRVKLINSNPCMVDWHFGKETSDKNIAELYVLSLGDNELSATFTRADGSQFDYTFEPVKVETFTYKPQFVIDLTGESGEKTWTWANDNFSFGLGGYGGDGGWGSQGPDYAQLDLTTLGYIGGALGIGGECAPGAQMTFKVTGELTSSSRQGTYSFDLDAVVDGWRMGKLFTQGTTVLYGRQFSMDPSNPIGAECFEYDIVACDPNKLVLCANMGGGMGTFFVFKPTEEVKVEKSEFMKNLTGEGTEKTWTWANDDKSFGLGGYGGDGGWGSQGPDYAQLDLATLGQIGAALGIGDECSADARMTFRENGELVTGSRQGNFTCDTGATIDGWCIGTMSTSGTTVLYGRLFSMDPSNPVGDETFNYDIISCSENRLVLCANMGEGMGTFFVFKPAE